MTTMVAQAKEVKNGRTIQKLAAIRIAMKSTARVIRVTSRGAEGRTGIVLSPKNRRVAASAEGYEILEENVALFRPRSCQSPEAESYKVEPSFEKLYGDHEGMDHTAVR